MSGHRGSRGASGRGRGRGGGRGGSVPVGLNGSNSNGGPSIASHVSTIGVKRPSFGRAGTMLPIYANCYSTTIPEEIIHHYDMIASDKADKQLPPRLNMEIITALQTHVAGDVFTSPAVYDGRKNMFSVKEFLDGKGTQTWEVPLGENGAPPVPGGRPPKVYKVTVTKVAEINPEVLSRFKDGNQSNDNAVATALMALNVVIRHGPSKDWPFNVRSFFTDQETKRIGAGITLWRGLFQSVRPGIHRMLINLDISTGAFFSAVGLIELCLEFLRLGLDRVEMLSHSNGLPANKKHTLQRQLIGVRVRIKAPANEPRRAPRVIRRLSDADAFRLVFMRDDVQTTVADYFRDIQGKPLKYPKLLCVEVGNGAWIPIELLEVVPGQMMRKQVPADRTKDVVEFATKPPAERLASIKNGRKRVLDYDNSRYLQAFGMNVDQNPVSLEGRVLNPPTLKYGQGTKVSTVKPVNGAWNMREKKFYRPAKISRIVTVIFQDQRRFPVDQAKTTIDGLVDACQECGIVVINRPTVQDLTWSNVNAPVAEDIKRAGRACYERYREHPDLIVVILPEGGNEIYHAVKHFGDVQMGIATQCLKSNKCGRAKPQYFANVCLKINVKLGGINTIPDPQSEHVLTDPNLPTIVFGADVVHPAPGSEGRPSFSAVVGNVDSESAKYVAESRVQESREEMIVSLEPMARDILQKYMGYREKMERKPMNSVAPKRLIFYRDGVSEGQFQQVLDIELPALKRACAALNISPRITIIVVGKRHHIRFFPKDPRAPGVDKLGNVPAGTVVDREVAHPTDFDFYLQSHAGLLGTSRPAHYSVLYDENGFDADALQNLSFALCHVYARSTRSVSIPAPVYYADIVCSRAKNHYDPASQLHLDSSDSHTQGSAGAAATLQLFQESFKPVHPKQATRMYFS